MAIVDLILITVAVILLVSGLRGSNVKSVEEYCRQKGNREYTLSRIEEFYNRAQPVQGFRADGEYFMAVQGKKVFIADSDECVWCYQNVIQHRTNFIPTRKTYSIIMRKSDGKTISIPMKTKKKCEEAMNYIAESMPYLFIGYSDELNAAYNSQLSEMVKAVADRKHQFEENSVEM